MRPDGVITAMVWLALAIMVALVALGFSLKKFSVRLKSAAASIFIRAEARGVFRKLPAFETETRAH